MNPSVATPSLAPARTAPSWWRWVHVGVAAFAMVATLPGRSHGLGLFTEPILKSFLPGLLPLATAPEYLPVTVPPAEGEPATAEVPASSAVVGAAVASEAEPRVAAKRTLDRAREPYGVLNLLATLVGAAFCLPCGWLTDRYGTRAVLVGVMALLAASVLGLAAWAGGVVGLFLLLLLTRGFGQSALSVASLTLIGRSTRGRTGLAMGAYSFLTSVGFLAAFSAVIAVVKANPADWRLPWAGIGVGVLMAAVLSLVLVRNKALDADAADPHAGAEPSRTLGQALSSGAFWAFALGTSLYGLVTSGTSLFNQSILAERGFDQRVFLTVTVVGIPVGLAANLLGGWAATKLHLGHLFAGAMALLAATLAAFPFITEEWQVYAYASGLAASGGVVTVCFFSVWRRVYGPAALGRIQGAAQLLTVLASGFGQALFPVVQVRLGSYSPLFVGSAVVAALLAALTLFVRIAPPTPAEATGDPA